MTDTLTQASAGDTAVTGANVTGRQLHDRATRGDTLTEAEQASLAAWYEQQDAEDEAERGVTLQRCFDEIRRLNDQMARNTVEIARLRAGMEALAKASRAIGTRTTTDESRASSDQMRALRQETLAAIASLGPG